MEKECSVDGCNNLGALTKKGTYRLSRGMCIKHYTRWLRHGDASKSNIARDKRSFHPMYKTYKSMKNRCYNVNEPAYKDYGGRGIVVCDRWLGIDGFWHFVEDMGPKPTEKQSLDRKDNDSGYSPENCRWTNQYAQASNTRNIKRATGFTVRRNGKFRARIRIKGASIHLGDFLTKDDATKAYTDAKDLRTRIFNKKGAI